MRHKIVLYNPNAVFCTMPLALLAVASALNRKRYEVVIVDGRLDSRQTLMDHLEDALCLGITVLTGAPLRDALAVTRAALARFPELPIVWGGWHPSLFPEMCVGEPGVTAAVTGQGEETFFERKERRQLDYISSQGCRFRCNFCADPAVYKRGWYGLAPERMVHEIGELWRRYRFTDLAFQDETYSFPVERRVIEWIRPPQVLS